MFQRLRRIAPNAIELSGRHEICLSKNYAIPMANPEDQAGSNPPVWRPASVGDLDAINQIADSIHPDLRERPEVFAEKLSLFPEGCFALSWRTEVVGYGLSHPWKRDSIPPLDTFLTQLPVDANCLYVADVAVLPKTRGYASARLYIELMVARATTIEVEFLTLVSVYETRTLWERCGFKVSANPFLDAQLKSYGQTAKYMTRDLGPRRRST
jgi:Acetyltransferase (GNAT) family